MLALNHTILEEPDQEALGKAPETIDCTQPFLQRLYDTEGSSGVDEQKYADKVRRTFERLRRASVKSLETLCTGSRGSSNSAKTARSMVRELTEQGVTTLENTIQTVSSSLNPQR